MARGTRIGTNGDGTQDSQEGTSFPVTATTTFAYSMLGILLLLVISIGVDIAIIKFLLILPLTMSVIAAR